MTNLFLNHKKKTFSQALVAWFMAFSLVLQGAASIPMVAYAQTDPASESGTVVTDTPTAPTTSDDSQGGGAHDSDQHNASTPQVTTDVSGDDVDGHAGDVDNHTDANVGAGTATSSDDLDKGQDDVHDGDTNKWDKGDDNSHDSDGIHTLQMFAQTINTATPPPVKVVATKIVCEEEAMLPNWGAGGPDISSSTAKDYVAAHQGCHIAPDWKFQWGYPSVKDIGGSFVGEADGSKGTGTNTGTTSIDWKTFGPTGLDGTASVSIDGLTTSYVWIREVLKDGYIPFTFDPAHPSNDNPVSAEVYCHTDVLNYDNYDRVDGPVAGKTYYCVAFNVKKFVPPPPPPPPPVCSVDIVSNNSDYLGGGGYATTTYSANPRWTAVIPGATWIWKTFFVTDPTHDEITRFTKDFVIPGAIASATLTVSADNSFSASVNGIVIANDPTEFNYFQENQHTYIVTILHSGTNTIAFEVKNWAQAGGSATSNPAGLLYKLHVGLSNAGCIPPPPPPANTKPVITVVGANPDTVTQGGVYTDPSATVLDAEDGNITNKLVATGIVNTNVLGTYTITYNATDSQNLAADTKTRTVNVVAALACKAPLDVLLVLDRSGSMKDDGSNPQQPLTQAKDAAKKFIDTLSTSTDHIGVVAYNDSATLSQALTANFTSAKSSITALTASGATNIALGIDKASAEIVANGRPGVKHVMILLSDGVPNIEGMSVASATALTIQSANAAKAKGIVIYTIGLGSGVNSSLMSQIATVPGNYYQAPTGAQLEGIYTQISAAECARQPATISGRKISDTNGNGVVDPSESTIANWQISLIPTGTSTLASRVEQTATSGAYTFSDVTPGSYKLCELNKTGWTETYPSPGTNNGCYLVVVSSGDTVTGKDFLNKEPTKPQCSDGKDNDGDGKIDYPADKGCDTPEDNDENNRPVITVTLPNPTIVTLGSVFSDLGATAFDAEDGTITPSIIATGTVKTNILGTYTITYNVKDSKNLAADPKTRTVNVVSVCSDGKDNDGDGKIDMADAGCDTPEDNDENNKPVITVVGANPLNITVGTIFTDPGATAFDFEDGTITPNIVKTGTVNMSATGTYTLFYNVKDSKNLAADQKTRIVNVTPVVTECNDGKDNDADGKIDYPADKGCDTPEDNDENNKPVITVLGANPFTSHIGAPFTDPSANATDTEDCVGKTQSQCNVILHLTASGTPDINTVGSYTITYNATDSKNLAADQKTRIVKVESACSDGKDNDGDGTIDFGTATSSDVGCDNPNDDSENQKPEITLLGNVVMQVFMGSNFTDPSATVLDKEDGDITSKLVTTGSVNVNTLGAYTITYNATDSQNLAADTKTRTVNVVSEPTPGCTANCGGSDNTRPVITVKGEDPLQVAQNTTFIDPGASAFDAEDGDITGKIVYGGSVNTATLGNYTITYNATDSQNLPAAQKSRLVQVVQCVTNCGGGGGGGGPISLSIMNERLTVTTATSVTITWNTNIPADSRVVYGLNPTPSLGAAPLYGYQLTTATDTTLTADHSVLITGIPSAIATYFRPVSTAGTQIAKGIELKREPTGGVPQSCEYIKDYMRLGINNDPAEVTKLQLFLKNYEGFTNLAVTGFFDTTTDVAVRAFQDKYKTDVLDSWNLPGNTGYVYYTTRKKINEIYCQREFPLTGDQLTEIAAFRALIASQSAINTSGGGTAALTPLVGSNTTEGTSGTILGAATVSGPLSGVSLTRAEDATAAPENRGRIALSDLLATAPSMIVGEIGDSGTATERNVAGASTQKHGLALVMDSIATRTHLTTNAAALVLLVVLGMIILAVYYGRRYAQNKVDNNDL